jgi:hypothetical protein
MTTQINGSTQIQAGTITTTQISASAGITLGQLAVGSEIILNTGAVAMGANWSMGTYLINNLGTPLAATDAATKGYVDSQAQGLSTKDSCYLATAAALPANTYNNGSSGVGATLTGNAFGALSVDGTPVAVGERILVKNEAAQANNGIYTVTITGGASAYYVLTRSLDFDIPSEIPGGYTFVEAGTANAATGWVCTNSTNPTIGTTAIIFTQFSGAGAVTAGTLISISGTQISLSNGTGIGQIIVTNGSNVPAYVTPSGDISLSTAGAFTVTKINGATLGTTTATSGNILVANGSNQWTSVTMSGDVTIVAGGATTVGKINGVALGLTTATSGNLLIANGLNWATTSMSGDATITSAGVLSISGGLTSHFVLSEVPSGAINGSNVTYTLANTPIAGTVQLYLNGIRQLAGAGNDYTISGATITYLTAPPTGSALLADYRK